MNVREIISIMIRLFPSVWGAVLLVSVLIVAVFGFSYVPLSYLPVFLAIAVLLALSLFIFYSKKDLNRKQMMIRIAVHFGFTLAVTVIIAASVWSYFQYWFLAGIVPLQAACYLFVIWLGEIGAKELSNKLNEGLEEYQEGK